jgi:hypothetical protein
MIRTKSVYSPIDHKKDGLRILVDAYTRAGDSRSRGITSGWRISGRAKVSGKHAASPRTYKDLADVLRFFDNWNRQWIGGVVV